MPGDIQMFLLFNFLLVLVVLYGFRQLLLGTRSGQMFSLLLAASGIFAFSIHSCFMLAGHPEFTLPTSLASLAGTLLVSVAQGVMAVKDLRAKSNAAEFRVVTR